MYVVGVRAGAHKVVFITKRRYRGVPAIMHFRALPPGNYTLRFATSFGPESVFKNCHSRFLMHVSR